MTTETDQTAGQLDEVTVLRVLEMLQEMKRDAVAAARKCCEGRDFENATIHESRGHGYHLAANRLVAMHRASLGLEEA